MSGVHLPDLEMDLEVSWRGPKSSFLFAFSTTAPISMERRKLKRMEEQSPDELRTPCLCLCCSELSCICLEKPAHFWGAHGSCCPAEQPRERTIPIHSRPSYQHSLKEWSSAGNCSGVQHWPHSLSFPSSAAVGWWGGMDHLPLCKRQGWEGTCVRESKCFTNTAALHWFQSAAGTGKCADHQNLQRSFWSSSVCCHPARPWFSEERNCLAGYKSISSLGTRWRALIQPPPPRGGWDPGTSANSGWNAFRCLKFCWPLLFLCGSRSETGRERAEKADGLSKQRSESLLRRQQTSVVLQWAV